MNNVKNKLRVVHFPQVGSCKKCFTVEVKDEEQTLFTINTLANQHLWLLKNKIIPDYSNAIFVEMYDEGLGEKGKAFGWGDYWNEEELMEWQEFVDTYLQAKNG